MARDDRASDSTRDRPHPGRVVIVGAVTRDVFDDREATGGAVSFAARVAAAFGHRASILTTGSREDADALSVRGELVEPRIPEGRPSTGSGRTGEPERPSTGSGRTDGPFEGHEVRWVESSATLTYRHRYPRGERELTVLDRPDRPLTWDDLPEAWTDADVLVLAPLLPDDIDVRSFRALEGLRERALFAQGLLREATPGEPVRMADGYPYPLFGATGPDTSIFLSGEEVAGWPRAAIEAVWSASRRIVVTRGVRGAEVRSGLRRFHVQTAVTSGPVVDTTGAGDVFATAFILALAAGDSEEEAARLASVYAAANIEQRGASPLPPLEEARRRIDAPATAAQPGRAQ